MNTTPVDEKRIVESLRKHARILGKFISSTEQVTGDGSELVKSFLQDEVAELCNLADRIERNLGDK